MMDDQVALAHGGHHVGLLVLVGLEPRLRHRRPRLVAQLGEAVHLQDRHEVLEVEQPVDVVDVRLVDGEGADQRLAQLLAHPGAHLEPHDLAEAAPAQLLLDRAQQIVRLVGHLEVGVARDAEGVVVDDLHAREQRVEMLGDQVLERHERAPVADRHEAREHLLRHLDAGEGLLLGLRVVHQHGERQREVGDVREGPAEADGERREDGEDLAPEALVELRAVARLHVGAVDDADPVRGQRRAQLLVEHARLAARLRHHLRADRLQRLGRAAAVLARALDAGVDVLLHARRRGP